LKTEKKTEKGTGATPVPFCDPKVVSFLIQSDTITRAITDQCADTITHPGLRTSNGSSILTRPSVGRS
jgi:hypothetical protein